MDYLSIDKKIEIDIDVADIETGSFSGDAKNALRECLDADALGEIGFNTDDPWLKEKVEVLAKIAGFYTLDEVIAIGIQHAIP